MRVGVWSGLGRLGSYSTGVGKHVKYMVCGLAARREWEVRLLLSKDLHARELMRREASKMDGIADIRLPFSRRALEILWRTTRHPILDRWLEGADWVYCPKELYVPVRNSRYAVTVHDLYKLEPEFQQRFSQSGYRWNRLLKRALEEADVVLSVSEFTKRRLIELIGLDAAKIRVVGNGVDDHFFASDDEPSDGMVKLEDRSYLLSIGGVTRKKGAANLLRVAAELAKADSHLDLVIVGPVEDDFAPQVASAHNIRVLRRGYPDAEMHQLVRNASLLMVMSEYEGFGIPALEAMAAGVPVIAADRAALPEVMGAAGLLVEPGDAEEVVGTILNVLRDADLRSELVARGRAWAVQFRWDACVERLCQALEEFGPHRSADLVVGNR